MGINISITIVIGGCFGIIMNVYRHFDVSCNVSIKPGEYHSL